MSNKTFIAAIIISALLISLVTVLPTNEVTKANFIPYGTVTIQSPTNQTYTINNLLLNISITFSVTNNKTVLYSLDEQPNVTISGLEYSGDVLWQTANTTLTLPKLPNGPHRLEVYANTNTSQILPGTGYAIIHFTVNTSEENTWSTMTPMPTARWGLGTAVVNNKIYAIGGQNSNSWLSTNEMYDPQTNTWSTLAPMPTSRSNFGIASFENKIYCIGGETGNGSSFGQLLATGSNEVYDPATNTWETLALMPTAKESFQAATFKGQIFCIGGFQQYDMFLPWGFNGENNVYNIANNTWTTATAVPTVIWGYASATLGNKTYLISGGNQNSSGVFPKSLTQAYDLQTNQWTAAMPPIEPLLYATAIATDGSVTPQRIYVFGGSNAHGQISNLNQVYDSTSNGWLRTALMPTARRDLAVAAVNDLLYAIGGSIGSASNKLETNVNERYTPFGNEIPPAPTPTPTPTATPTLSPSTLTPTPPQNMSSSPAQSTSPIPTAASTPNSSPTQSPTSSASPSTNTPDSKQDQPLPQEVIYGTILATAIVIAVISLMALKKEKQHKIKSKNKFLIYGRGNSGIMKKP